MSALCATQITGWGITYGADAQSHRVCRLRHDPDRELVVSVSAFWMQDPAGQVLGVTQMVEDVTDRYRARRRLALLNDVGARIGTTLDVERTAREPAEVAVPDLADCVSVDLLEPVTRGEEPGQEALALMVRAAGRSISPEASRVMYPAGHTMHFPPGAPQARWLTERRPVLEPVLEFSPGWSSLDPDKVERVLELGVHSLLVVPLVARGLVLGVVSLWWRRPEPLSAEPTAAAEGRTLAVAQLNDRGLEGHTLPAQRQDHLDKAAVAVDAQMSEGEGPVADLPVAETTVSVNGRLKGSNMFRKVLVANRGEIAIRAFRASYELGAKTVAVFPHEDRNSLHRLKADEAHEIGEPGHPVRAYLSVEEIVRAARRAGADAVYPGYGFLSENPDLARACEEAGITFVGPSAGTLELTGNKARAVAAARAAGVPVLGSSEPSSDVDELVRAADDIGFPVFVKAVAGGGGRGMRRVEDPGMLRESIEAAAREAASAFGDPTVFLEKAVVDPRHIEVQILADGQGEVIHLFERDCSLQRRHQKVIELAPAPNLDPALRERICADAVRFAREIGYRNAGTVEFLLDRDGNHVFIEMNPRIQVEHTVTEEVTDVDLVQAQLRIAAGESLPDLGLTQDTVALHGAALQCRITTEDPANAFRPDTGRISAYRSPGGSGIRLDGGTTHAGTEISAHFDSMLVKLSCRGRDFSTAIGRARRAVAEFRIRGVATNIPFLQAVLDDPDFRAGRVTTSFIEERPHLLTARHSADRGTKLLTYLADVTVNKPHGARPELIDPITKLPPLPATEPPAGSRQRLAELGPERFARWLRESPVIGVTDTTFRDAHQSLLATRVRTKDMLAVAPVVARTMPQLLSLECWGGATYDVALRFLAEDPWERLAALREAAPNICLQMLLRGRNTVGYTPYPTEVTDAFVQEAEATGIDIFRIFDALNDVGQMRPAIDAVRETGTAVAEVALCYTSDLSDPSERLYTLDYYLRLAEQIVDAGAHVLAIKDMAGLLRAPAAEKLVSALRREFDLPVHLHTHDTAGGQLATYLAAIRAGADAVDGAVASMAGTTSQPSLSAIVAATDHSERPTGLDLKAVGDLEPYWESVRRIYAPFEAGLASPTGRVYHHEIPGGQLSNLRTQAVALGLGDRFEDIEAMYAAADRILGRLVKVTPSSKVVGDLALHLVGAGVKPADFEATPNEFDIPDSVIGFLRGELGNPPGGWPEPFRAKALEGRAEPRPVQELTADDHRGLEQDRRTTLNRLLFPGPARDFETHRQAYGDTSVLDSKDFFYGLRSGTEYAIDLEPGVRLLIELEAIGEADERGMRTVVSTLNGQLRPIQVRDTAAAADVPVTEKADRTNPGHVAAPFAGVVTLAVAEGDEVAAGTTVATIEAMKMEAAITAPKAGRVTRLAINQIQQVEGGDLLVDIA